MLGYREELAFALLYKIASQYGHAGISMGRSRISACSDAIFALELYQDFEWETFNWKEALQAANSLPGLYRPQLFLPFGPDPGMLYQISDYELMLFLFVRQQELYDEEPKDEHDQWPNMWLKGIKAASHAIGLPKDFPAFDLYDLIMAAKDRKSNKFRIQLALEDLSRLSAPDP